MPTNKDNNWVTINGGNFPATIGEEFINTWGKWELSNKGDFNFNDSQATWQDSQNNGSFRDYVGIGNKNNMLYWMEGDYGDKKSEFDFNSWADSHKEEYSDYRDENGTWYLTPEARTDLEGKAYTQWLKEQKYDVNNTTPVVRIKTGSKEGTQVYYKWDDSVNAYVPYEGKVVYWDTNSGLGHALKGVIGIAGTALSSFLGGPWAGLAFNSAFSGLNSLTNGDSLWDSMKGATPFIGSYIGGDGNTGWLGEMLRTTISGETDKGNLSGIVNQWKYENKLLPQQQSVELTEEQKKQLSDYFEQLKLTATEQSNSTSLGNGSSTSLGSNFIETEKADNADKVLLGALGGAGLLSALGSITTSGNSDMADENNQSNSNLFGSLLGLGADAWLGYGNYKQSKDYKQLANQWSNNTQSLILNGQNLANSLQNLYDKRAGDNDKLYEALKEKIKVPTRNGDEWKSTPYYQTATQGTENVNNAFAKALGAADTINQTWTDLGKAKMYTEDDVYDTYRKFANARTQLADRAAALTDSRTYAANRANGVGTSTVQNEAAAENARKYMADLANIDSQAYTDALKYVNDLSKLQLNQRDAAISEAVKALSPTITTSTTDANNQLKNSQNEIGALWYGDKAADLERGWLANTYGVGLQNQNAILNALLGLNTNNVNASSNLLNGFANAYAGAMNGLAQNINKGVADAGASSSDILSALGKGASSLWDALSGSDVLLDGLKSLPDSALGLFDSGFHLNLDRKSVV